MKEDYDKISIVMICLNGMKAGRDKGEGFIRLLNTLLAEDMTAEEKGKILSEDYDIEIDDNLGEEMSHMCNLGEGIRESAKWQLLSHRTMILTKYIKHGKKKRLDGISISRFFSIFVRYMEHIGKFRREV